MDFRTEMHLRHENTKINWDQSYLPRHVVGRGPQPLHEGYEPFKYAARGEPQTQSQREVQKTRKDAFFPFAEYPQRPFKGYAFKKWKEIEVGPEIFT
jgi:hypothetical protein